MSKETLIGLRDYLYSTLSPANMLWLGTQLTEYANQDEEFPLKCYTKEEINAMLDKSEAEIAAGKGIPDEEAWDELEAELEIAKAV
ncbi:MAG: hypothetical protein J5678_02840 [Bacteroidaceae bacterium]|nr:hypothetical protein [Bacteroidaceae bacterium]